VRRVSNPNTIRRFTVGDDFVDALLLRGRASAKIEFDNHIEFIEVIVDNDQSGVNAIYKDR